MQKENRAEGLARAKTIYEISLPTECEEITPLLLCQISLCIMVEDFFFFFLQDTDVSMLTKLSGATAKDYPRDSHGMLPQVFLEVPSHFITDS